MIQWFLQIDGVNIIEIDGDFMIYENKTKAFEFDCLSSMTFRTAHLGYELIFMLRRGTFYLFSRKYIKCKSINC